MTYDSYYLKLTKYQMLLGGIWPATISNKYLRYTHALYSYFLVVYFIFFISTFMLGSVFIFHLLTEAEKANLLVYLLSYCLSLWKIWLIKRKCVKKIMKVMVEVEENLKETDQELYDIYREEAQYNFKLGFVVPFLVTWTFLSFMYFTVHNFIRWNKLVKQGLESGKTLIFPQLIPFFNPKYIDYYYFYQITCGFFGGCYIACTDALIGSLIMFTATRTKLLGAELERFGKGEMDSTERMKLLRVLILKHKNIISAVADLNDNFRWLFFLEFTIKTFHITQTVLSMFELTEIASAHAAFRITEFLVVLFQGIVIYFQASRVSLENENLGDHIYNCEWIGQPVEITKCLLIMMTRTTRLVKLECYGVVQLSNALSVKILQALYTFVMLRLAK